LPSWKVTRGGLNKQRKRFLNGRFKSEKDLECSDKKHFSTSFLFPKLGLGRKHFFDLSQKQKL
jgi:hypothetical protein